MPIIIAVVGMPGSGKSSVVKYLIDKGFYHVYLGQPTFDELKQRGLDVNEQNERAIREELRQKYGMDTYARRCLPAIEEAVKNSNVVVESMYSWEEYLLLKGRFGGNMYVAAVSSDFRLRAKRMKKRKERPLTAEELRSRDTAQVEKLSIAGPIAVADFQLNNNSTEKKLYRQVDKILGELNG